MQVGRTRSEDVEELYQLACKLLHLDDYDSMLVAVMECALRLLRADRGFLAFKLELVKVAESIVNALAE